MTLAGRDKKTIWHPYTQMMTAAPPIGIVRGEGACLYDEQGNEYIDAVSSWWVNVHGHANRYIGKKIAKQLNTLEHVMFAGFTHEPAVTVAEMLLKILPNNQQKVFYSDNGSTAVEVAVKMALQYWHNRDMPRRRILVLEHSYHGDTFGAMSVSARSTFTRPFENLLFEVVTVPFPEKGKERESHRFLEDYLAKHGRETAAMIVEPLVLGAGGMLMYKAADLDKMFAVCKKYGVLSIADEVMTGFGRTGKMFACEYLKRQPDIICLSKGITGGYLPLGVTTCTDEIYNAFYASDATKTFFHGHSYTANPLSCAAAAASLELFARPRIKKSIATIAESHGKFAHGFTQRYKNIRIRQTGTILAFDIVTPDGTSYFHGIRDTIYHFFLDRGIIMRPLGNTFYVMPPYCITKRQLQKIYRAIHEFAEEIQAK